ncbi:MAG: hypothetical protein DME88_09505 [Verrucomicrobia bacterium]|nr:MAG: hypothetical protein DME88_09505 [Verrucomicrobiota bacterium]
MLARFDHVASFIVNANPVIDPSNFVTRSATKQLSRASGTSTGNNLAIWKARKEPLKKPAIHLGLYEIPP